MSQLLSTAKPATRRVRVRAIHTLSPRMHRVVFTSATTTDLTGLAGVPPGMAIKLMFPYERAGNGRALGRAYTIHRYHTIRGEFEVDFIVHDETPTAQRDPAARWLEHAAPGGEVEFANPRRGFRTDPAAPWTLLIGDETALPAIFAILETLPERAQVLTYTTIGDTRARLPLKDVLATHPHSRNIRWVESDTAHVGTMVVGALNA